MRLRSPATDGVGMKQQPKGNSVHRARPLLGTMVDIRAGGRASRARLNLAVDQAFAAIEQVQRLMSYHDPASELSRLNRDAVRSAQQVDPHTYTVLQAALRFARLGEGAFDPCVARYLETWAYLPDTSNVRRDGDEMDVCADSAANWRDIELMTRRRVRFRRPLRLDLGGIAKGYAVDLAVQTLQQIGIQNIIVNAGGDLRLAGTQMYPVQIRHPRAPDLVAHSLNLRNAAIATSATCFSRRRFAGREVSPLVDARTGDAYVGDDSISVCANDCMTADALTKLVLFAPAPVAERALTQCDAQAIMLRTAIC